MRMRTLPAIGLAAGACLLGMGLAGCNATGLGLGEQERFSSRPIPGATRSQVYQAALAEVRQRFQVGATDPATNTIQAQPQYLADTTGSTGQLRIISSPSDRRRAARVRVSSIGGVVRAEARVEWQRRDTAQLQQYDAMRSTVDAPTDTPVSRGQALSPEQRDVWTAYGRDFDMENELLTAIERHFAPATQPDH